LKNDTSGLQDKVVAHRRLWRFAPLALILVALAGFVGSGAHRALTLEGLLAQRSALRAFVEGHYAAALGLFALTYAALTAISAPGATIMTLASGALFGVWVGAPVSAFAATLGACLVFGAARTSLGAILSARAGPRLALLLAMFQREAVGVMLFLRLSPAFPFFLVNLAAALGGAPFRTYVWTTALGVLPACFVFAGAGAGLDQLAGDAVRAQAACRAAGGLDCPLKIPFSALFSTPVLAAFIALSLLALAPALVRRRRASVRTP
jgi:uncharacterized membrane protein YdjX (TVP38/TMEM64 family)